MKNPSEQPAPPAQFDSWAIVEVMGHTRVVGKCSEQSIAGKNMLRIDVPEATRRYTATDYSESPYKQVVKETTVPAHTRYFGADAIFSITPCSEEIARKAAEAGCSSPPVELALPERILPAADVPDPEDINDDEIDDATIVF